MGLLLRKVIASKWLKNKDRDLPSFSSDPITACNRTSGDTLSVWRCNSTDFDNDITLQMIIAGLTSGFNEPTPHEFIFLDEKELDALGLKVVNNAGNTAVKCINELHADISGVDYSNLGVISQYIRDKVCDNNAHVLTLTKDDVIKCVGKFYASGDLKKKIKKDSPWEILKEQSG